MSAPRLGDFAPDCQLVDFLHPSGNIEDRDPAAEVDILLLHYTGCETAAKAIEWLAAPESRVSCHYVVDVDGCITQMVSESMRAWHAGESCWCGQTDINSRSIGIEIQNPGHEFGYPDFPDAQMEAVIRLSRDILSRHPIPPRRVLAHSDIAPHRKIDPGEKFDWARLAREGIGHWVVPTPIEADVGGEPISPETIAATQRLLREYGYALDITGEEDRRTRFVVRAFQLHFRPARVDNRIDRSTIETLQRLSASNAR